MTRKIEEKIFNNSFYGFLYDLFYGNDKSKFIKRNEYGYTCLIDSLEKVINYCEALNETFIDVSVRPRREQRLFSSEAFKEAWINACVHNKWSEELAPAVYWFDDRLEIVSYGGILKNLTREEFLSGKTNPVNKELMSIFLQCEIVEHSGHGVPIVIKEYGKQAYSFSKNMITVTIPFNKKKNASLNASLNASINACLNASINACLKLTEVQKNILLEIEKNNQSTIIELSKLLHLNETTISRNLKVLIEKGTIERIESRKSGHWKIKE